ncbi:MAG: DNA-3-methyladenine glycosylase 2 family protein [Planctomycetaceae bacterium]|nr:DNA-3-methyladenine glycosylase 2 family protein [Planctomycetaceae bacterium]
MNKKAAAHLSKVDRILRKVIAKVGPGDVPFPRGVNPYRTLVTAVAHQQLTGKAANTILGRVIALYPGKKFPAPEDLIRTPDSKLRAAGFSRAKVAAVKDIAAKTIAGVVPTARAMATMSDVEIVERLTSIRGVGPWTVEMMLIFTLGRPDVLPCTDYGVRKGFAMTYRKKDLPSPKELLAFGERWKPHRSAAAWYLWRATELFASK